jgi:hypothetical protein
VAAAGSAGKSEMINRRKGLKRFAREETYFCLKTILRKSNVHKNMSTGIFEAN